MFVFNCAFRPRCCISALRVSPAETQVDSLPPASSNCCVLERAGDPFGTESKDCRTSFPGLGVGNCKLNDDATG